MILQNCGPLFEYSRENPVPGLGVVSGCQLTCSGDLRHCAGWVGGRQGWFGDFVNLVHRPVQLKPATAAARVYDHFWNF